MKLGVLDLEKIAQELHARTYRSGDEPGVKAGVYALFADSRTAPSPLTVGEDGLLYIGMTVTRKNSFDNNSARQKQTLLFSPNSLILHKIHYAN
jgi:hypothetical protein